MGRKGAAFGFSAFAVSVGVSYFARLAGRDAELRAAAEACADFAGFVAGAPTDAEPLPAPLGAAAGRYGCGGAPRRWLVAVHLACILLAAKNIDRRAPARACQAAGGHAASPGGALSTVTGGRGQPGAPGQPGATRRCVQEGSGSYALSEPPIANTTIARFVVIGGARRRWPNETFTVLAALWHSRVLVCAVHLRAR